MLSTLRRDVKDFISSRKSERDSIIAQAETQQRLSGVGTQYGSPPAKPPLPPSSLDQVFSSLTLKSTPVSPGPPPPLAPWTPAQKAAYTGRLNLSSMAPPYSSPSPPTSQSPPFIPPPPTPNQLAHVPPSTRPPYPPSPPVQSPYGIAPPQPQRDPYAGLASLASATHFPLPPSQRQASYPLASQQQSQTYQSLSPPAHAVYTYSATPPLPTRQGSTASVLPPPPPPVSYSHPAPPQNYSVVRPPYGVPPPPSQQQPYGGFGQYGRQS